jgi:hypothetical protein
MMKTDLNSVECFKVRLYHPTALFQAEDEIGKQATNNMCV